MKINDLDIEVLDLQEARRIYKEIFKDNIYEVSNYKPLKILDLGAYIGISTIWFADKYPEAKIVALEPNKNAFALLRNNTVIYSNVSICNKAIGIKKGIKNLYVDKEWESVSSFYAGSWLGNRSYITQSVEVIDYISLTKKFGKFDFIKLDIEGFESKFIKSNISNLNDVKVLVVEFHETKERKIDKFLKILRKAGFVDINIVEDNDSKFRNKQFNLYMIYAIR